MTLLEKGRSFSYLEGMESFPPKRVPATPIEIEVFFDGACPLCLREVQFLHRLDRKEKILFTDIMAPGFDPESAGVSWENLMARIYGKLPDGSFVTGVEVFRYLYGIVGFGFLVPLTRLPGVSALLDLAYKLFAKNRLRLTGRCHGKSCTVPARE